MFADVLLASTSRLMEVRIFLQQIGQTGTSGRAQFSPHLAVAKGLFFVHLYGVFEFSVTNAVLETIQGINSSNCRIADCKPVLYSLVFDAECTSLASVGKSKTFQKRWDLFNRLGSPEVVKIPEKLIPTDSANIGYEQLQSIWVSFCVQGSPLPRQDLRGRLVELVENRNAIAHGRESPQFIGGRYTYKDLNKRYEDVDELCTHVIKSLEGHIANRCFVV